MTPLDHILKRIEELEAFDKDDKSPYRRDLLMRMNYSSIMRALKILANHAHSIEISTSPLAHSAMLGIAQAAKELGHVTS